MLDVFLLVGLPYLALVSLVGGSILRYRTNRFSYSALSSQFLESRLLRWGSPAWHLGVLVLLVGHLVPVLVPGLWQSLVARPGVVWVVEAVGLGAAFLAAAGLVVLLARRVTSARLQPVSTVMDVLVLVLLLGQVALGIGVAVLYRWGAVWSTGTTTPYLWSLLTLRPDTAAVAALPPLVKIHLATAWVILLLVPFTRLVHLFSLPLGYLFRPPQKVVWASTGRLQRGAPMQQAVAERRLVVRGLLGLGGAGLLLSVGVLDKLVRFFSGPDMTLEEEAGLLRTRLKRLEATAEERELQLERMRRPSIRVARLEELSPREGRYFIDYRMRPALAFRGADGLPLLISAQCTHLGCTVASQVDDQGRLLCPCHVSFFDLDTGRPNAGSPAKAPLPLLGWVLTDGSGAEVARRRPDGTLEGAVDPARAAEYEVHIVRDGAQA